MKKILYILFALPLVMTAQDQTKNYVKSTTYKTEVTEGNQNTVAEDDKMETVTYYDALGRPMQAVNQRAGGNKEDIISHIEYDIYGRQIKENLPFAVDNNLNGNYISNPETELLSFYADAKYDNTTNPFSLKDIEESPLARVFEQAAPGEDWKIENEHTIKFEYTTNAFNEVKYYYVSFENGDTEKPLLNYDSHYEINQLYKSIIKDENWTVADGTNHTTEEFKDMQGRVVLKRTYADVDGTSTEHDTYYVYDDYGNLTFVIPPLGVDNIIDENSGVYYAIERTPFSQTELDLFSGNLDPSSYAGVSIVEQLDGSVQYYVNFNLTITSGNLNLGDFVDLPYQDLLPSNLPLTMFSVANTYDFNITSTGKVQVALKSGASPTFVSSVVGNYSFVLPPLTNDISTNALDDLCYQYIYDSRNRLVEKKIPGKGWEYIVYDKLDRPILTQDANQRLANESLITKYDALGRVALTGLWNSAGYSRDELQQSVTTGYATHETRITTPEVTNGQDVYYSSSAFPTDHTSYDVLTVNYYDDYDWSPDGGVEASYTTEEHTSNFSHVSNILSKTNGNSNLYDAGFTTNNKISDDGYVQFTINNTHLTNVIGLSKTADEYIDPDYVYIDYGIMTGPSSKRVYINEEGVSITPPLTYANVGDVLRIERVGSQIFYKKNGNVFYVSTVPSTGELIGDGSLRSVGSPISNLHIGYSSLGQDLTSDTQGLATGSVVNTLDTSHFSNITSYYDVKGRPIHVESNNAYLNTSDVVSSQLDFVGKPLKSVSSHIKDSNDAIVIEDKFSYDHADRLLVHQQQINNEPKEEIVRNVYDELGQLVQKKVGRTLPNFGTYTLHQQVEVVGNLISKTRTSTSWLDGVSTQEQIAGDGYVSFMPFQSNKSMMVGLSYTSSTAAFANISYALHPRHNGKTRIHENGSYIGVEIDYLPKDEFVIERIGTTVSYKKNGAVFHVSTVAANTTPMRGDAFFYGVGGKIQNLVTIEADKHLQTVDYTYNIRGWLKNINEDTASDNDLFNFSLFYNDVTDPAKKLYNGNISKSSWNTLSLDKGTKDYEYAYDALNRIIGATDNTGLFNLYGISYDKNGNIQTLNRKGHITSNPDINTPSDFGTMDELTYVYNGNRLTEVNDAENDTFGFKDGVELKNEYTYDVNGNLLSDANKGITSILYNHLSLPTEVKFNNSNTQKINYTYDASGVKLKKVTNDSGNVTTTDYASGYVYKNNTLQHFPHTEGYVEPDGNGGFQYVYSYVDHLGNVRLNYSDLDNNGSINPSTEILQERNTYPFGLEHKGYNNVIVGTENNHKTYQGQELNEDLGYNMHEYKWRHYDASIGRFNVIDPLATDFPQWAPYVFSGNFVTISKELEGLEPEFMINGANGLSSDNRLTTPMVSLLSATFGYSPESLQGTTYHRDSDPRSHWFGQKVLKYNSSVIAITVGSQVINRSDLSDRSSRFWFSHIAHEQQHRSDIDTYGGGLFYLSYGLESIRALGVHDNLGHEKSANSNEAYAKQLWDYNGGEVRNILGSNRGGTLAGQGKLLESVGARFRRDVILDDTISGAESLIGTTQGILKDLGNSKEDQGIRAALGNMISAWQQNIKDAKKEQDDITKKYGN